MYRIHQGVSLKNQHFHKSLNTTEKVCLGKKKNYIKAQCLQEVARH